MQLLRTLALILGVLIFGLVLAALPAAPALAEATGPEAPGPEAAAAPSADELSRLVETLEDDAARKKLVEDLRVLLAARQALEEQKEPPREGYALLAQAITEQIGRLSAQFDRLLQQFEKPQLLADWLARQWRDPARRDLWIWLATRLVLLLATALAAAWIVRLLLTGSRRRLEARPKESVLVRLPFHFLRTLLDILPIAAFGLAGYGGLLFLGAFGSAQQVMMAILNAIVIARLGAVLARMLLTPFAPGLRLLPMEDAMAAYLYVWARRLINLPVYGYFALQAASALGMPGGGYVFFEKLIGMLVALMVVVFILQNRSETAARLHAAGGDRLPRALRILRDRFAEIWHLPAIFYVLAIFVVWLLEIEGGFAYMVRGTVLTVALLVAARLVQEGLFRASARLFRVGDDIRERFPFIEERTNRYVPVLRGILAGFINLAALLAILQAWEIDILDWLTGDVGRDLLARVFSILSVIILSAAIWEAVSGGIQLYLERRDVDGKPIIASARARTLLPLIRNVLLIFIAVMATMVTLSEFGVNIAPLIAGAGVVGLAVGFGAQTLVKDFITGLFILFEDTVQVGDLITIGEHTGVIEGLTIRTVRLRDAGGNVHTIPFGSVDTIVNLSKEYSFALMDIGVGYREDVDEVMAVLEEVGADLRRDEKFGPLILEPIEVMGLNEFGDSAVVIRCRIKTKPREHLPIRREFYRRLKRRFDELDIEIPFPHQTLYFGQDKQGRAPLAHVRLEKEGEDGGGNGDGEAGNVPGGGPKETPDKPPDKPPGAEG